MERHGAIKDPTHIHVASFDPAADAPPQDAEDAGKHIELQQCTSIAVSMQPLMVKIDRKSSEQAFTLQAAMADYIHSSTNNVSLANINILDIMRESSTLLRINASALTWTMFILICPLSALLLSSPWLLLQLRHSHFQLEAHLHSLAASLGILHSSLFKCLLSPLISRFILFYFLSSPVFFTSWLLAKAFITFTVSATYSARKPSLQLFFSVAPKLWRRLLYTYLCIGFLAVVICAIATLTLSFVMKSGSELQLSEGKMMMAEMVMGVASSMVIANAVICADVATVVCVLEENVGMAAMRRAMSVMKGRMQAALWLVLVTAGSMAIVESLYESRVVGVEGGRYEINAGTRLWEAPLLICMHAFLLLYHAIMTTVFYFTCKTAAPAHQHYIHAFISPI